MRRLDLYRFILPGLFLNPAVAVAQQDCKPLTEVKKLPALTSLLDSAGVVTDLPTADSNGPGEVLVSVKTGATLQAFVMDSLTATTAVGTVVLEKVLSALKPGARNAIPAFRVRVVSGPAAMVFVEPSVLCGPRAKGPPSRASFTVAVPSGPPGSRAQPPRTRSVSPRIKIGINGEVLQVDLGAGTGYPEGDRSIRLALEGQRYDPALLDGRPVQVWLRGQQVELVR